MDDQNIPGSQKNVVQGDIQNVKSVVIGDNNSTTNNFFNNAEVEKKTFNMYLTRKLTEAISIYNDDTKDFLKRYKDVPNWETQDRFASKAQDNIVSGFVGVLGMLLRKVIAIGKESVDATSASSRKYIKMCIATATSSLQLLLFAFIAKLWDYKKENKFEFTPAQLDVLNYKFFTNEIDLNIPEYVTLLQTLVAIFLEQNIEFPFNEFDKDCFNEGNILNKTCNDLYDINKDLDANKVVYATAFTTENALADFLCALSFFANYKMISIKEITYNDVRNAEIKYLHSYTFLDGKLPSSKYKYDARPVSNDAVLIYKDAYQQGVNLFPFIIDGNALTNQSQVRICFYRYFEEKKKRLTYADIDKIGSDKNTGDDGTNPEEEVIQFDDNVEKNLLSNVEQDITELIRDKFKNLQWNMVYKIFQAAKKDFGIPNE